MSESTSPRTKSTAIFTGEPFERVVAILIALVTLLAAIVGFLQADAGSRADQAGRDAQRNAIQAMGHQVSGATQVAYDWSDAYQTWYTLDTLALSADNTGDDAAAERYRALSRRVTRLSPLLAAPYFDPASGNAPDIAGYEADVYLVKATAQAERYLASAALDNAWSDKANTYVTHLTLLAVTLFLFGLSVTMTGRTRWLFLGAGLLITAVTMVWLVIVLLTPVPRLAQTAIDAFARGVGLAHRGDVEGAVAAYDQALAAAPTYANALYERGNALYELGDFEAAARDFEAAQAAGRDDINVAWNLGWTYYLLGDFDQAVSVDRHAVELDPTQIGVRFNLALALLAAGQIDAARAEYANALAEAQRQVVEARAARQEPPSSLWLYMEAGARDLDSLIDTLNGRSYAWTEAPAAERVAEPGPVEAAAQSLAKQLRDLTVALEIKGQPPTGLVTARVSPFEFGQAVYDDNGDFVNYEVSESFAFGIDEVLVLFDYEGMVEGQEVLWKVYWNAVEDPSYRLVEEWALGEAGSAEKPLSYAYSNVFTFSPGDYVVEMYVDSHLVQRGGFAIEAP